MSRSREGINAAMKQQPTYDVYLNDPQTGEPVEPPIRVVIRHGDQLRAELEGPRHGLRKMEDAPMHYTTLWVWSAMVRLHHTESDFRTFVDQELGELEPVKEQQPAPGTFVQDGADVDPTKGGTSTPSA